MLQFYTTTDEGGLKISINPNYVAQIESYTGSDSLSFIVMNCGKRYLVKENCIELTKKLEKLANYNGC
jgi:uncharacterized protein YlzI (FlbEa/FlbD family)